MALSYFAENRYLATVLAVSPLYVENSIEEELLKTLPKSADIVQVSAISHSWTRLVGFGGIGFRAYGSLKSAGDRILRYEGVDAVYFSSTVFASFLLGPYWKRKHGVPYFIDYQDPWWSEYYSRPGAPKPPGGWLKYGIVQWLARKNEGRVIRGAAGVTCVSGAYVEMLRKRYPDVPPEKFIELPFGAPERDFDFAERGRRDGSSEVWRYIGRGGQDMSVAVKIFGKTVEELIKKGEVKTGKIDFQIAGTSYATRGRPEKTIEPILQEECSTIQVTERTDRIGYMETLKRLMGSDRLVLFGSDDAGYTASKLYPYILAKRPLLVICREESSVARIVRETKSAELITFGDEDLGSRIEDRGSVKPEWQEAMRRWLAMDPAKEPATDWKVFEKYTAKSMTQKLCKFFDERLEAEKTGLRIENVGLRGEGRELRGQKLAGGGSWKVEVKRRNTRPRVLLFHPGVQHAPRLAEAMEREGMLESFWTGWAEARGDDGNFARGRRNTHISKERLKTRFWVEWIALGMSRIGMGAKAVWHLRNEIFQRLIPREEMKQADVIIGFDTASWILAKRAKEDGKKFILDQTIGHPAARRPAMEKAHCGPEIWPEPFAPRSARLTEAEKVEHELADRIVVGSRFARVTLVEHGVEERKIRILPYGVGEEFLKLGAGRAASSQGAGNGIRFLFLGQLSARKGLRQLLEAWGKMDRGNANLELVGGGDTREWKKRAAEGVIFQGQADKKGVLAAMKRADILVLPSLFEGFGLVILEAMAAGLPVIATQNTGGPDVIEEGREGFIVPAGNTDALRERMVYFIQNPEQAAKMGRAAHLKAAQFTWERYGQAYGEIIKEVILS